LRPFARTLAKHWPHGCILRLGKPLHRFSDVPAKKKNKSILLVGHKGLAVRRFRWLIIAVFVLPWLGNEATAPAAATDDMSGSWRRTNEGWQRIDLFRPIHYRRPALHPAVVGLLQVLLTMTAMLALSDERSAERITEPKVRKTLPAQIRVLHKAP